MEKVKCGSGQFYNALFGKLKITDKIQMPLKCNRGSLVNFVMCLSYTESAEVQNLV